MELRHRILEFSGSKKYETLKAELDKLRAQYKVTMTGSVGGVESTSIDYFIAEDNPHYPHISKLIKKYGFYVQSGIYYSQEDIDSAEWLQATTGQFQYPQPEDDYIATTYDISDYHSMCGIGAIQNQPFRLKSDFTQKRCHFFGLHWIFDEVFVRPEVKQLLEEAGIGQVEFMHPILHKNGKPIENLYQMMIGTIASPGLMTKGVGTVTCKPNNEETVSLKKAGVPSGKPLDKDSYCGRVKYHYPRTSIATFRRSSLPESADVAKSYEYYGSGHRAERMILVSQRFASFVKQHKLRGLQFTPVKLV